MSNKEVGKRMATPLAAAVGAAFVASAMLAPITSASENPFAATELSSGYNLAEKHSEGKCGEGKCGEAKKAENEGKCGEGKCGDAKKAEKEGKCGEGKCGEAKAADKAAKEGKCGEGKCGAK